MLGGVKYAIRGAVRSTVISNYAGKVVVGDTTRDSQVRNSVMAQSDWRSGIGLFRMEAAAGVDRGWWSTANLRYKNQLTHQRLANITAAAAAATPTVLIEYANEMYATFEAAMYKYDDATDSWGASLQTLAGSVTDGIVTRVNDIVYLILACNTSGYTYFDGVTWTNDTEQLKYVAWWDDKIWGIDNTGQLRYSTFITPGTWVDDAQLPLPDGFVTDLFIGADVTGSPVLYAMTKVGLYAHDFTNSRFVATKFSLPLHPNNGIGCERWRDSAFINSGLGIYRYLDGVSTAVVSLVGPDRDDGVPSDKRGIIRKLVGSHNELLALVDATTGPATTTVSDLFVSGESFVLDPNVGFSSILGWDEQGWQVLWLSNSSATRIETAVVANAYDSYRLWWSINQRVYWMTLPQDIVNPNEVTDFDYAESYTHETPWFNAGQQEVNKLGLSYVVDVSGVDADNTITLSYGLDLNSSWTVLEEFNVSNGVHRRRLPSEALPEGIVFQWIRFKVDSVRASGVTTAAPSLHVLELVYRKKLEVKKAFTVQLDFSSDISGRTPSEQRAAFERAVEMQTLLEFTYRPDDAGDEMVRHFWVDVVAPSNVEESGIDERGLSQVTLVEG